MNRVLRFPTSYGFVSFKAMPKKRLSRHARDVLAVAKELKRRGFTNIRITKRGRV